MEHTTWEFEAGGGRHAVTLEYDSLTGRERLTVDGEVRSDRLVWKFVSRYRFEVAGHACEVTLNAPSFECGMLLDGVPVGLTPAQYLVRPAAGPSEVHAETLLRPAHGAPAADPSQLLRPAAMEDAAPAATETQEQAPLKLRPST